MCDATTILTCFRGECEKQKGRTTRWTKKEEVNEAGGMKGIRVNLATTLLVALETALVLLRLEELAFLVIVRLLHDVAHQTIIFLTKSILTLQQRKLASRRRI